MISNAAALVSAVSAAIYAIIAAASLVLLARQVADARRYGAAPALYGLLRELDEHSTAIRRLGTKNDDEAYEAVRRHLEFFERVEHLRMAGVLPADVLRRAFGTMLPGYLADPRFRAVLEKEVGQHDEVLRLARWLD